MTELSIDIETYSSIDLIKCGVYRYVESPDFEILLFAYAYDDEPIRVLDLTDFESIPERVLRGLTDPNVIKTAYNANFERTCIAKHFGIYCDPRQWQCTSVWALTLGLPGYLEGVAEVLKLDAKKDARGKALIKYFSVPCKPTKVNGMRTRNYPHHEPDKWEEYKAYNKQDVVVEREVRKKISRFPVPAHEWRLWSLDQQINDRGVRLDPTLFRQAIACNDQYEKRLIQEAQELTGLENPNSLPQLKSWLSDHGLETPDGLGKDQMPALLDAAPDEEMQRVLELRQEMSKTSVDKYNAMDRSMCEDERARGLLQFQGANRTGRWAGRLIQVQNLPQNKIADLAMARETLRNGDFELLEMLYGPPPFVLSQLIRTAFIPTKDCRFIVADFSAIEARVIAWLADEHWVLDVFRGHGKIYEATAAQMFKVPFETIVKGHRNYELRSKGKVAVLACIAEGQPVLTDKGLVPIEGVTTDHLLWDGVSWVHHDGVIDRGVKEVFEYDGLTATADHIVWIEGQSRPVRFEYAAASGSRLVQSGSPSSSHRQTKELERNCREARVYDILNAGPHNRFTVSGKLVHNCGYQGGPNALIQMGALKSGIPEDELPGLVKQWRDANPNIRKLWYAAEAAAVTAVRNKTTVKLAHGVQYRYKSGVLFADLPSGRSLAYINPRIKPEPEFGKDGIVYDGMDQIKKKWMSHRTYGGRLVENLVQGIARDCLAVSLMRLDAEGYKTVMHVHDEVVADMPYGSGSLAEMNKIMGTPIDWAPGLPLKAAGYECDFYQKD